MSRYFQHAMTIMSLETWFENKESQWILVSLMLSAISQEKPKGAEVAFAHKSGNDNFDVMFIGQK